MDFCEIDSAAEEIVALIDEMAGGGEAAEILLEIQGLGKSLVNRLTPERDILRWERISYEDRETCECCGSVRIMHVEQDVPVYDTTPVEDLIAQYCKDALPMYLAGQTAAAADANTDFAALRGQIASARDLLSPAVKAERDHQDHLADLADAASW